VVGRKEYRSPSLYSDDRESAYYDPNVFADETNQGSNSPSKRLAEP
jgi:hypothetical protein